MIYIFITFLILLLFTINPKYLGKFKFLALQNVLSKSTTQTIQHGLFLVFILWLLYCLFEKEFQSYFQLNTKENFTNPSSEYINQLSEMGMFLTGSGTDPHTGFSYNTNPDIIDSSGKSIPEAMFLFYKEEDAKANIKEGAYINSGFNNFNNIPGVKWFTPNTRDIKGFDTDPKQLSNYIAHLTPNPTEPKPVTTTEPKPVTTTEPKPVTTTEPKPVTTTEPKPVTTTEPKPVTPTEPKPVTPDDLPKIPSKQDKSSSDEFRPVQPSIVQGLDPKTVVGSPIYYEPGTTMYNGLGYSPSYSEMIYLNNHVFKSEPKKVVEANVKGFCNQSDNIMNNINEKCNALPSDVCASTECCVLFGGEKCVEGDENGPKNKAVYSDTSIKNRDVYYYQGDCYGNCQKGPRYVPPKQPETKPKPPTPAMISPAPSPAMISPAPSSAILNPSPSPAMISPAPSSAILNPSPSQAEIQPVPNQNSQDLPNKLVPPPQTAQPQLLPEIPTQTMSIPGQNPETLPNANSIINTIEKDFNSMVQSLE
jgi:hypothetical protein